MRVAVISDVHSNLQAMQAVLKEVGGMEIFCCGDLVGYGPFPNEVIELVMARGITSILGNHDYAAATRNTEKLNPVAAKAIEWTIGALKKENFDFLKSLPRVYKNSFCMVHGSPKKELDDYIYADYPDETFHDFLRQVGKDILVLGHTHVPYIKKFFNKLVFNPGSVGQPRDTDKRAAYAVLDTSTKKVEIKRADYDVDFVADAILKAGLPDVFARRLYSGW